MRNWRTNLLPAVIAIVVMAIAALAFNGGDDTTSADQTASPSMSGDSSGNDDAASGLAVDTDVASEVGPATFSDLPTINLIELPIEALDVLGLIHDGGPYPYRQDDGVFQNREGILPDHAEGHYREYTVDTPGSPDRGARRIVAGDDGERYYTDDHYDSFREIDFGAELSGTGS